MARNVEIKARVHDMEAARRRVSGLAAGQPESVVQTDTFFRVEVGRLKLREFADGHGELIFYRRPDAQGPKESQFERVAVPDTAPLRELLASALGVCGRVHKRRLVYQVGRTRVHLDEVRDLGDFLELEVELEGDEPADAGIREAQSLMRAFGVEEHDLVAQAYVDLLSQAGG